MYTLCTFEVGIGIDIGCSAGFAILAAAVFAAFTLPNGLVPALLLALPGLLGAT